jgi:hypothetical protein
VKELEKMTENFSIKSEDFNILQETYNENLEKLKAYETSQAILMEENMSLKGKNGDFEEKIKENQKNAKNLVQKVSELQNSHLSLARSHNEKSEDFQRKFHVFEEENRRLKEEMKKNDEQSKFLKENSIKAENVAKGLEGNLKKYIKEIEDLRSRETQNILELETQKRENFDLSEKIKIKIKGYSILKSHFYQKYEEMIKLLIQKDKELDNMKNVGKENVGKGMRSYEIFKKKKNEIENNDLENELNKDWTLLKEGRLSEKSILESLDVNTTMNSAKDL